MAQQTINIGAAGNDGTGDSFRAAFDKCNDNFGELYDGIALNTWNTPSLLNSWATFNSSYDTAQYMIDGRGVVYLRGLIKNGSAGGLFTLPSGYRPAKNHLFPLVSLDVSVYQLGAIRVESDGDVVALNYATTWLSLAGICFEADGA